jgi:hypothetical protein
MGDKASRSPVDHGRLRRALERLRALLRAHPEARERTARYLAGELKEGEDDATQEQGTERKPGDPEASG